MPTPQDILHFWFTETLPAQWWAADPTFDARIAERFGALHARAAQAELSGWRSSAEGCAVARPAGTDGRSGAGSARQRTSLMGLLSSFRCRTQPAPWSTNACAGENCASDQLPLLAGSDDVRR